MGLSMSLQIELHTEYLKNDLIDLQNSKTGAPEGIVDDLTNIIGNIANFGNILKQNDFRENAILARKTTLLSIKFDIDFFVRTKLKKKNSNLHHHLTEILNDLKKLQEEHIKQSQLKSNDLNDIQKELDFILQIIDNYKGDKDESDKIKRNLESVEEKIIYGNLSNSTREALRRQVDILSKYWREKELNIKDNKARNKNSGQYSRSNELLLESGYSDEFVQQTNMRGGCGEIVKVSKKSKEYEDAQDVFKEISQLSAKITNYKGEFDTFEKINIAMKLHQERIEKMNVDEKIKTLLKQQIRDLKNYINEKQLNIAKYSKEYDSKSNESSRMKFNSTRSGINLTYTETEKKHSRNLTMNKTCWRET